MAIKPVTQADTDSYHTEQKERQADIEVVFDTTCKAFALVVLDEINNLRNAAGLPERTVAQLKKAVSKKI